MRHPTLLWSPGVIRSGVESAMRVRPSIARFCEVDSMCDIGHNVQNLLPDKPVNVSSIG